MLKNPPFCSFVSFLTVSVTPFNKTLECSSACTIFVISFISSLEIIKVVLPDPSIFLCIPASAADAAAVNPKGINTLLANGLITFFIKVILLLIKHQVIYLKNHQTELFY